MKYSKSYFSDYITNNSVYWAHFPKDNECFRQPELLSEHSSLVYNYARIISEKQNLFLILENLIGECIPKVFPHNDLLIELSTELFWRSIAFHDLGKVNKQFQKLKMKNINSEMIDVIHAFGTNHSIISVYVFLADFFSNI